MLEHTSKYAIVAQGSSDRVFGLVFTIFFLIVGIFPLLAAGRHIRLWALVLAAVFLLLALVAPGVLAPANRIWTRLGALLHCLVSPIALGVLFFGVVMPTGLIIRLIGNDLLRLRFDSSKSSYWILRNPSGPDAASLKNQF